MVVRSGLPGWIVMSRIALPILLIAEFIIVLLLQWRPDIEARLDPSQFRAEGEYAYFTLVPPIAPRLR